MYMHARMAALASGLAIATSLLVSACSSGEQTTTPSPTATRSAVATASPLSGPIASFGQPQTYRDGISLNVSDLQRFTSLNPHLRMEWNVPPTATLVRFVVRLNNGSQHPWTPGKSHIVVRAGKKDTPVPLVCDPTAGVTCRQGGTLPAGTSRWAVVGFAAPAADLQQVTIEVLPDTEHNAASWTGAVLR